MIRLTSCAIIILVSLPFIAANCNIDSAGIKTHSTSDGQVITRVAVVATFRLGCQQGTEPPKLHAETADGQYLAVTESAEQPQFKEVSLTESVESSKSRWIEIKVFDDQTYSKLLEARKSGSSESYYKPLKSISVSHYGVYGGPLFKMETVATLALVCAFIFAVLERNKIVS